MVAFYLRCVERTCLTTHQHATREGQLGQRVQTTLVECSRAVAEALAALQILPDDRMLFELLEFIEGTDVGIAVTQIHNESHRYLVVLEVIEETTAGAGRAGADHRVARRVHDQPLFVLAGRNLPHFLDANSVVLRIRVLVQSEAADQLLAQVSAATFREDGIAGMELKTWLITALVVTFSIHSHIASSYPLH